MADLTDEELDEELALAGVGTNEDFVVLNALMKIANPNEAQWRERYEVMLRVLNRLREEVAK